MQSKRNDLRGEVIAQGAAIAGAVVCGREVRVVAEGGHVCVVSKEQVARLRRIRKTVAKEAVHSESDCLITRRFNCGGGGEGVKVGHIAPEVLTQEGGTCRGIHHGPRVPHDHGRVPQVPGVHCGTCEVASDAFEKQVVPLPRHAVSCVRYGESGFLFAVGAGVGGADVACVGDAVQIEIRRARCQRTVVGHDHVVSRTFPAQNVHQTVVVDVEQRHVVAVGDPIEVVVAVGVQEGTVVVFIDGHASAAVAGRDVHIHVGNDHVEVAVQIEVRRVHVAPEAVGRAEIEVDGVESKADVGGVGSGGQDLIRAIVHHVEIQEAIAVEIHHFKHVRRRTRHEVLPRREVARAVVEQHDDPPGIPWEHVVEGGVLHDVQIAVPVHVVDLACCPKCTVEQVARTGGAFVGEMAGAVVDEQEILRGATSAVDAVVHEVEVLCTVARQVAGPHRTYERLVADECGKARVGIVRQAQPIPVGVFPEVHVQHGLLVERVHNDHVIPRVAIHVHDIDVSRKTGIGDELRRQVGGHVDQYAFLVDQQQVGLGRFGGGRKGLFAHHDDVGPPVFVEVCRPNVFFLVVSVGDAGEHEAFIGLDVPFEPLRIGMEGCPAEKEEAQEEWKTWHAIKSSDSTAVGQHRPTAVNLRQFSGSVCSCCHDECSLVNYRGQEKEHKAQHQQHEAGHRQNAVQPPSRVVFTFMLWPLKGGKRVCGTEHPPRPKALGGKERGTDIDGLEAMLQKPAKPNTKAEGCSGTQEEASPGQHALCSHDHGQGGHVGAVDVEVPDVKRQG